MSNVATLNNILAQAQYLGDGVFQALEPILRFLPPAAKMSDGLTLYVADALHTIVEISDTVGAIPLALIAKSNGTACTVKLYAEDSGDVTVGTTDAVASVGVSGTSGEISAISIWGKGIHTLANASGIDGLSIAAPATDVGTGAVASDPTVYVLYF